MITVNNVSKKYKIPHEKKYTFFEYFLSLIKKKYNYEEFYALKNISFKINQGEFIGIIGKNGSGKTTLLRILSKIILPTHGTVLVKGKVASFLSTGIGFHPELTAKENIFLYGAIMGINRKKIKNKLMKILTFAEVERFADAKLKNFSSGMIVRLAFSTMIRTNADIMILDEIFALGDKTFIPKSTEVFRYYKKKGKTIILVSHDLNKMEEYCDKVMLLDKGEIIKYGPTKEVIDHYRNN